MNLVYKGFTGVLSTTNGVKVDIANLDMTLTCPSVTHATRFFNDTIEMYLLRNKIKKDIPKQDLQHLHDMVGAKNTALTWLGKNKFKVNCYLDHMPDVHYYVEKLNNAYIVDVKFKGIVSKYLVIDYKQLSIMDKIIGGLDDNKSSEHKLLSRG